MTFTDSQSQTRFIQYTYTTSNFSQLNRAWDRVPTIQNLLIQLLMLDDPFSTNEIDRWVKKDFFNLFNNILDV